MKLWARFMDGNLVLTPPSGTEMHPIYCEVELTSQEVEYLVHEFDHMFEENWGLIVADIFLDSDEEWGVGHTLGLEELVEKAKAERYYERMICEIINEHEDLSGLVQRLSKIVKRKNKDGQHGQPEHDATLLRPVAGPST